MKTWTTTPAQIAVRFGAAACFVLTSPACDSLGKPEAPPEGAIHVAEPDLRTPKKAATPPPPIQGGSLLALRDGMTAVVGDPDRHRVMVVSLDSGKIRSELELEPEAQPGRLVEDVDGHVHIVLRGSHALLELDPETGKEVRRHNVCGEPRGLAYHSPQNALLLACADGTLWTYAADTGDVLGETFVARDLRDVVVSGAHIWVSTFRSAEVFRMGSDGSVAATAKLPKARTLDPSNDFEEREFSAEAAWRMVASEGGSVTIVHQQAADDEIGIDPEAELHDALEESAQRNRPVGGSAYGGGGGFAVDGFEMPAGCNAIVTSAVSRVQPQGHTTSRLPTLGESILPVDVAVSDDGQLIAVVSAGPRDEEAPRNQIVFPEFERPEGAPTADFAQLPKSSLHVLSSFEMSPSVHVVGSGCTLGQPTAEISEPAISVAFVPGSQRLLVQTREPAKLYVVSGKGNIEEEISLGGVSVADTGHDLFHRDSGGGIACASCHMEGAEDGHTWRFSGLGARRTQPLNVRLAGTQPFHWDGTLDDLGPLMEEVFVGRMGGAPQAEPRLSALADWMLDLDPPAPIRADDDPAVLRGKKLFESTEVQCASCHSGPKFTNNESFDVGTSNGEPLQVPSLLGVGHRGPLMHDGCAPSLAERFDPSCGGGEKHGKTAHLSAAQLDDLIAYLDSL